MTVFQRTVFAFAIALLLAFGFWVLPEDMRMDALWHPVRILLGSDQRLNATLIEVAQEGSITRKPQKPSGDVTLLQTYPPLAPGDNTKH